MIAFIRRFLTGIDRIIFIAIFRSHTQVKTLCNGFECAANIKVHCVLCEVKSAIIKMRRQWRTRYHEYGSIKGLITIKMKIITANRIADIPTPVMADSFHTTGK